MDRFDTLQSSVIKFRDERDWKQYHTPENLAKSIAIEAGELLENFQWGDVAHKKKIVDELADVLIYSFLLADSLNVSVFDITHEKLLSNEKRFPVDKVRGNSGKNTKISEKTRNE